jgi:two-component sensor histidine kinase
MVRQKVIDRKNEKLELLVNEKEWLLKEVHHRVKNNLQIVISLLNSQSTYLKDSAAFDAIQDSQARINSMAMIHLKLYKSYNTLSIDLPDYIKELVNYFKASYIAGKQVEFRLELTPLLTDVSIAVPLALILNEAITNSLKHAFPDRGDGIIVITLKTGTGSEMEMAIADNGVGLSPGFDMEHQTSLGINLIRGLSGDIEGKCVIDGSNGTTVLVIFGNEIPNRTLQ